MKEKKRWPLVSVLWFIFIFIVVAVVYLSFQNGEDAKALGSGIIEAIAGAQHPGESVTDEEVMSLTYYIRQFGRAIAFVVMGIVGTVTIHVTCRKNGWFFKTAITTGLLFSIAYLTEKLKVFVPSRHYSQQEMIISLTAAAGGVLLVSVITLFIKLIKGVTHRAATATHS